GTCFLAQLLRMVGLESLKSMEQARAWREDQTWLIDNQIRRIDITVDFPHLGFGIGIENKPWASDQTDQVADYVKPMRLRYGTRFLFMYWSGHGGMPTSIDRIERETLERENKLRVWSYRRELRQWLQTSRDACQAPKVCWFLDDLLNYLTQNFAGKLDA